MTQESESELEKVKKESRWPIYVCTNKRCVTNMGDRMFEQAWGTPIEKAPLSIKCTKCGFTMKLSNKIKK